MKRSLAIATTALALAAGDAAARGPVVEYLQIGASEGSSLGGHAALRVEQDVYHFQHREPGLLVLDRTDLDGFTWDYGTVQNRPIRTVRLRASPAVGARIRTALGSRYVVQRQHLAVRESLARDRALLHTILRDGDSSALPVGVRGAELFFADGDWIQSDAEATPTIVPMRPTWPPARILPDSFVDATPGIAERRAEQLEAHVARAVLLEQRPVRPNRLAHLRDTPPLAPRERAALRDFAKRLRTSITRLAAGRRPDWGFSVLMSLARLAAVEASLRTGHLVVVDSRESTSAPSVPLPELMDHARVALETLRIRTLRTGVIDDLGWTRLQDAGVRLAALHRRAARGPRAAEVVRLRGLPPLGWSRMDLQQAQGRTEAAIEQWDRALRATYAYDLFRGNCVTAVLDVLADAGLSGVTSDGPAHGAFIPRMALGRLASSPSGGAVALRPSYRQRALAAMRLHEPSWLVRLREDNVLTTRLPTAPDEQPAFLFFTDDTILARPVYGAANLTIAILQAGMGLVSTPFDRARRLRLGLRGMLASAPELAFASVRTGRFRPDPSAAAPIE